MGGCGAEAFDEPTLLEVALAAVGDDQRDDATHAADDGQGDAGDVDLGSGLAHVDGCDPP
ncbi:hypothetical protein [Nocardia sputorum]|uniref:hypothetical protein n=1 Tax=Nocardia sputorum TaxID=2984338 RepID=UPI00331416EC